jgi:hypothetical protein
MNLRSLLDLDLPTLADAEQRLGDLATQRRRRLTAAAALGVLAVVAELLLPQFWFALAAGAGAAFAAAVAAFDRRRSLLAGLLQVREAYRLEAVSNAGARFASLARRRRLAGWLRKIVRAAEGEELHEAYSAAAIEARVLARRERLLALASALETADTDVHPAGVAIVHRLLTRPSLSPLYNPGLDEEILDVVLYRAERCVDLAA